MFGNLLIENKSKAPNKLKGCIMVKRVTSDKTYDEFLKTAKYSGTQVLELP